MIKLHHLNKYYASGRLHVLKDVSLQIDMGEKVSIVGTSGSGKSTLLQVLGLLDSWSDGIYTLCGRDVDSLSESERARVRNTDIGFVFQSFELISHKTALENVELPLYYADVGELQRRKRAQDMLVRMGIAERMNHLPSELSGGQKQRVAIARALINNPSLLLADEPTGALDKSTSQEIMHLLDEVNQMGVTVIVVTHDMDIAKSADRMIRIEDGVIFE